eukprot:scaffold48318_cov65-Phaeocystis_antarctica.AAC.2
MGRALPAGRGGWRCDRRPRREGGHDAARRRAGVRLRSGAAPCAPLARPGAVCCAPQVASPVLPPPSGFAAPASGLAPSLHSCDADTTPPCA